MSDNVQRIKDKLSIIDVVAPYVKLTRAGKYWKGLSPFNKEKTPSFMVSPDRGTYYCFSSSQGGDIFTFTEKMEGVDFSGALKILAEKAGIRLEYEKGGEDRSKADRLAEAMARAEQFYAEALTPESEAYTYALSRGLTPETIKTWRLGVAPDSWRALLEHLAASGFSVPEMVAAGLVKEADGKPGTYYDRFRNRLMFPIRDTAGRTVAFTGRALGKDDLAKYLNSPETELFKKSEVFFGMSAAKDAIRTRGFTLLVEGQMDLLHAHQAGFTNAVALSGTALSDKHIALLMRYSENLMLALDSDRAGINASGKSAHLALARGMRVKAVRLPEGKDPADIISADPEDFKARVKGAKSLVEFYLDVLGETESNPHRLMLAAEKFVLPFLKAMKSPMEREYFASIVARTLGMSDTAIKDTLNRMPMTQVPALEAEAAPASGAAEEVSLDAAHTMVLAAAAAYPDSPLAKHVASEYIRITGMPLPDAANVPERYLFEAEALLEENPDPERATDLVKRFERAYIRSRLEAASSAVRRAESLGDGEALTAATTEWSRLASLLKTVEQAGMPETKKRR